MLRNNFILVIFAFLASFLWAAPLKAQGSAFPQGEFSEMKQAGSATVLQVLSPLTLKLDNGDIARLSGVHFPDYTPDRAGPFSLTALKIMQDMLEGQAVVIYQTKKKDWGRTNRMGHTIMHLARKSDGAWVQGTLIGLGLAQVKTSQRTPEMATQLYALESTARKDGSGLWAEDAKILTPESAPQNLNSFQIIEGTILSAALKKNRVYLNFGGNWRDDFTVSIAPEDRRIFSKQQINPLDWNGRTVRVRGWLENYNGPYIEIDHPEALELLETQPSSE